MVSSRLGGKSVLVTGATGFIGSHLVQALLAEGARVRALAHYRSEPSLHNLAYLSAEERERIEIVKGDVCDSFFVRDCVAGCDIVFHLAALIAIPYSYRAPASYVATNVNGTLNVLDACLRQKARMVHTSTSECYGTAVYTPIDENHPLQGQSPYSATKIAADKLVESYYCAFGLDVITVRPFNTFGPRQSARAVIPTIVSQLVRGAETVRLGSLEPIRDFTFVTDTAAGLLEAGLAAEVVGEVVNLGFGRGITVGELASRIMKLIGRSVPLVTEDQRVRPERSEVFALISNNRKAFERIGWQPRVSLDEGLCEVIRFAKACPQCFGVDPYGI